MTDSVGALPWLKVSGDRLVDEGGATLRLTGFGLGGLLNHEDFISGYPGNEEAMRRHLLRNMGSAAYEAYFEAYERAFFSAQDAAYIASLGMNSVRVPVNYRQLEDDARPFAIKQEGLAKLDRVIDLLAAAGLYAIIDLHAAPGYQNHHWHSDNPTHQALFWQHPHFQDRVVYLWEALAERYRDRPEVAGYNPLNEPADESGVVVPAFYRRLERAIRKVDDRHILFLDGNRYSTDFSCFDEPFDNTVYAAHDYAGPGVSSATEYPGHFRGEYFDKGALEQAFLRRTEFMRRTGTPIWVGEFGPMYPPEKPHESWRYQVLEDQLDIYDAYGASWALWTYKDIGLQGVVYVDQESEYLRLIRGVLDLKRRLGTDSWGGSDLGVRDILDPIDAVMDSEFPDYNPYPWGRRQHVFRLVRHILLAEPLAETYAALFAGVTPERARELAASFSLEQMAERRRLVEILRGRAGRRAVAPGDPVGHGPGRGKES